MGVVLVCAALVVVALGWSYRWRDLEVAPPAVADGRGERVRRWAWWVQLWLSTSLVCGILVIGAGGRLAMRLLGATAGDQAQGRLTEADQVVGEITVGGTVGFVFFVGVLSGLVTGALWLLVRRALPPGWLGGLLFGAGLLVVFGTRNDPLRPDNEDFDLVGPWWLAILVFTLLALAFGVALAAVSGRLSRSQPLPGRDRRSLRYALLLLLVPLFPFGLVALVGGIAYVYGVPALVRARAVTSGSRGLLLGRLTLGAVVLVAAPGFVTAIGDLVGRGP